MYLRKLTLTNFKNHKDASFDFQPFLNCIVGKNGVGKTNILDSIYYLAFTKSALSSLDRYSITHEASSLTLFGEFDEHLVAIQIEKSKPKQIKLDRVEVDKISAFIGTVPLVIILPDDTELIKEGSEVRRRFIDGALSQMDPNYLVLLMDYNRTLKQRNSLLKQMDRSVNHSLFETYDDRLIPLARKISQKREELIRLFEPYLKKNYQALHLGQELPSLQFKTQVNEGFEEAFKQAFEKDLIMQRTMVGSHRDDLVFLLDNEAIKKFGSQGQQKTFIISLKFALYDYLKESRQTKPLLLLDDIFDKLDDNRIELLVNLLRDQDRFGQVFITDARKDRSKALLKEDVSANFIELA